MTNAPPYRYIPRSEQSAYEALGWVVEEDLGIPDPFDTLLIRWTGDGEPQTP